MGLTAFGGPAAHIAMMQTLSPGQKHTSFGRHIHSPKFYWGIHIEVKHHSSAIEH